MFKPVYFEIHADDVPRAMKFYESLFGWKFARWENPYVEYYLITAGPKEDPGIDGAILKRMPGTSGTVVHAFICTVEVPNVDEYLDKGVALGGQVALPKLAFPGVGYFAYVIDTEGNTFGILQRDANAA